MEEIIKKITDELERAEALHPDYPNDIYKQLAIITEESGEVAKSVLHYEYEGGSLQDIKDELVQTAAMCIRMLKNLPKK